MDMFNFERPDELAELKELYTANTAEIKKLQNTNKYLKRNILVAMRGIFAPPFIFGSKTYDNAQKGEKKDYEFILELLQRYLTKDIKEYTIITCGYDNHGVCLRFALDDSHYELYIPIWGNITERSCVYEDGYIDYDIAKYRLLKEGKNNKNCWSALITTLNMDDIKSALEEDRKKSEEVVDTVKDS